MAMKKISELDEINVLTDDDLLVVVDTTLEDTNKITKANAFNGYQKSISSTNKVNADYIDDSTSTNKFVTASDKTTWSGKQDHLTAGTGIDITNNVISNTQTSAEWGNITGTLADQTDLKNALDSKANSSDLSTVATSGSYNDLSNKPTIPTVNNATLTIQKNGSTVKTFTANASTNVTANITVPTKVSDLTNDSGFLTSETDPVFTASTAYGITASNVSSWNGKQDELVSGTNIKTINNQSLLGSGNIDIQGGGGSDEIAISTTEPSDDEVLWINPEETPSGSLNPITNTYSVAQDKGYSCEYLNNNDSYSTTEVKTNKRWIDGKPIYRKVLEFTSTSTSQFSLEQVLSNDANEVISINGMFRDGTVNASVINALSLSGTNYQVYCWYRTSQKKICLQSSGSAGTFNAKVIVEYTKTTD